ncbi:50S ribosomal protein L5 [Patescibacteria group bacterium]
MESTKQKQNKMFDTLKGIFEYKNVMQTPRVTKVIVSTGVGSTQDKDKIKLIPERLAKITGQKPTARAAKKSIATFKLREGDIVGYAVTLRGQRMHSFLDKLFNVVLPRTRDFKGLNRTAIDEMGNLTIGIKEHTIFSETSDEELKNVFGLSITLTTTAKTKEEAEKLFEEIGVPFKKK